jgi:hypothetical protein
LAHALFGDPHIEVGFTGTGQELLKHGVFEAAPGVGVGGWCLWGCGYGSLPIRALPHRQLGRGWRTR